MLGGRDRQESLLAELLEELAQAQLVEAARCVDQQIAVGLSPANRST